MPLINCEVNSILTWSSTCVITDSTGEKTLAIRDTKLYVPVVTLSTTDNAKLLEQLKSGFKKTINWNKYQSKMSTQAQNQYLDFSINPSFQGVNRLFVLPYENENGLSKVEIKDCNVKIDGRSLFDQPINNDIKKTL